MAKIVLINNVYSYRNRGDSAIVEAIAHSVQSHCPDAEVYLISQYADENASYYDQFGWHSVRPYWDIPMKENKLFRLWLAVCGLGLLLLRWFWSFFKKDRKNIQWLYRHADLLIDAGGGSWYSSNKYKLYLGFYQHTLNVFAGSLHCKAVVIAPQSIGPIYRGYEMACLRFVLRRLDRVCVREQTSYKLLKQQGIDCVLSHDCAFLNNFKRQVESSCLTLLERVDCFKIGVTVFDWGWASPIGIDADSEMEKYLQKVVGAIAEFAKGREVKVYFYSHADVAMTHSDHQVAIQAADYCKALSIDAVVMDPEMTASDLMHAYSRMDLFIGSRMHSVILALLERRPAVALSYQPKTEGVMRMLGLGEYCLDVYSFEQTELLEMLCRVEKDMPALVAKIDTAVSGVTNQIEKEFEDLANHYLTPGGNS